MDYGRTVFSCQGIIPSKNGGGSGVNRRINEICRVTGSLEPEGNYLLYGRTFELTQDGTVTSLTLGLPAMLE